MKVVIYGADKSGKKAYEICRILGLDVIACVDADKGKAGTLLYDIIVKELNNESEKLLAKYVVVMGTNSKEAHKYIQRLTENVIDIDIVKKLYATYKSFEMPPMELQTQHIDKCKLIPDRVGLLYKLPQNGIVAEVGVFIGEFSRQILDICKPQKLFLIDLWEGNEKGLTGAQCLEIVKEKFVKEIEEGQVEIIKSDSVQAIKNLSDGILDWVYLDTVHDYITPHNELEAVRSKLNKNGLICGHDYSRFNDFAKVTLGVWSAVNEFVINHNYEFIYLTMEDRGVQSYAIQKQEPID